MCKVVRVDEKAPLMEELGNISLEFSSGSLKLMNVSLALIMFAVALGMDFGDFQLIRKKPGAVIFGLISQWIVLPLVTVGLIYLLKPHPLLALGMILVAVCPGGNVSNFFTMLAGGNVGLSVVLTGFSSIFAAVLTPLGFGFWVGLSGLRQEAQEFSLSFSDLASTLFLILVIPLVLGGLMRKYLPKTASWLRIPAKVLGILILAAFIGVAIWKNRLAFVEHLDKVFWIVLIHNSLVLLSAYFWSYLSRNDLRERKTITLETGIQNSGLALLIIFGFFNGNGGMAIIAAWWGVWHLVAGSLIAMVFSNLKPAFHDDSSEKTGQ